MQKLRNKKFLAAAKFVFGAGLFFYIYSMDLVNFSFISDLKSWPHILFLLFIQVIIFVLANYKWSIFTKTAGLKISLRECLYHSWLGQFFTTFLPSFISADLAKFHYLSREGIGKKALILSMVLDRGVSIFIVCSLAAAAAISYVVGFSYLQFVVLFTVLICAEALLLKLITSHLKKTKVIEINAYHWIKSFVVSAINFHLKALSLIYIAFYLLHWELDINWFYLSMAGQFFDSIPLAPANIGVGHFVFYKVFQFMQKIDGAQVFNIYFTAKILFKLTGLVPWVAVGIQQRESCAANVKAC